MATTPSPAAVAADLAPANGTPAGPAAAPSSAIQAHHPSGVSTRYPVMVVHSDLHEHSLGLCSPSEARSLRPFGTQCDACGVPQSGVAFLCFHDPAHSALVCFRCVMRAADAAHTRDPASAAAMQIEKGKTHPHRLTPVCTLPTDEARYPDGRFTCAACLKASEPGHYRCLSDECASSSDGVGGSGYDLCCDCAYAGLRSSSLFLALQTDGRFAHDPTAAAQPVTSLWDLPGVKLREGADSTSVEPEGEEEDLGLYTHGQLRLARPIGVACDRCHLAVLGGGFATPSLRDASAPEQAKVYCAACVFEAVERTAAAGDAGDARMAAAFHSPLHPHALRPAYTLPDGDSGVPCMACHTTTKRAGHFSCAVCPPSTSSSASLCIDCAVVALATTGSDAGRIVSEPVAVEPVAALLATEAPPAVEQKEDRPATAVVVVVADPSPAADAADASATAPASTAAAAASPATPSTRSPWVAAAAGAPLTESMSIAAAHALLPAHLQLCEYCHHATVVYSCADCDGSPGHWRDACAHCSDHEHRASVAMRAHLPTRTLIPGAHVPMEKAPHEDAMKEEGVAEEEEEGAAEKEEKEEAAEEQPEELEPLDEAYDDAFETTMVSVAKKPLATAGTEDAAATAVAPSPTVVDAAPEASPAAELAAASSPPPAPAPAPLAAEPAPSAAPATGDSTAATKKKKKSAATTKAAEKAAAAREKAELQARKLAEWEFAQKKSHTSPSASSSATAIATGTAARLKVNTTATTADDSSSAVAPAASPTAAAAPAGGAIASPGSSPVGKLRRSPSKSNRIPHAKVPPFPDTRYAGVLTNVLKWLAREEKKPTNTTTAAAAVAASSSPASPAKEAPLRKSPPLEGFGMPFSVVFTDGRPSSTVRVDGRGRVHRAKWTGARDQIDETLELLGVPPPVIKPPPPAATTSAPQPTASEDRPDVSGEATGPQPPETTSESTGGPAPSPDSNTRSDGGGDDGADDDDDDDATVALCFDTHDATSAHAFHAAQVRFLLTAPTATTASSSSNSNAQAASSSSSPVWPSTPLSPGRPSGSFLLQRFLPSPGHHSTMYRVRADWLRSSDGEGAAEPKTGEKKWQVDPFLEVSVCTNPRGRAKAPTTTTADDSATADTSTTVAAADSTTAGHTTGFAPTRPAAPSRPSIPLGESLSLKVRDYREEPTGGADGSEEGVKFLQLAKQLRRHLASVTDTTPVRLSFVVAPSRRHQAAADAASGDAAWMTMGEESIGEAVDFELAPVDEAEAAAAAAAAEEAEKKKTKTKTNSPSHHPLQRKPSSLAHGKDTASTGTGTASGTTGGSAIFTNASAMAWHFCFLDYLLVFTPEGQPYENQLPPSTTTTTTAATAVKKAVVTTATPTAAAAGPVMSAPAQLAPVLVTSPMRKPKKLTVATTSASPTPLSSPPAAAAFSAFAASPSPVSVLLSPIAASTSSSTSSASTKKPPQQRRSAVVSPSRKLLQDSIGSCVKCATLFQSKKDGGNEGQWILLKQVLLKWIPVPGRYEYPEELFEHAVGGVDTRLGSSDWYKSAVRICRECREEIRNLKTIPSRTQLAPWLAAAAASEAHRDGGGGTGGGGGGGLAGHRSSSSGSLSGGDTVLPYLARAPVLHPDAPGFAAILSPPRATKSHNQNRVPLGQLHQYQAPEGDRATDKAAAAQQKKQRGLQSSASVPLLLQSSPSSSSSLVSDASLVAVVAHGVPLALHAIAGGAGTAPAGLHPAQPYAPGGRRRGKSGKKKRVKDQRGEREQNRRRTEGAGRRDQEDDDEYGSDDDFLPTSSSPSSKQTSNSGGGGGGGSLPSLTPLSPFSSGQKKIQQPHYHQQQQQQHQQSSASADSAIDPRERARERAREKQLAQALAAQRQGQHQQQQQAVLSPSRSTKVLGLGGLQPLQRGTPTAAAAAGGSMLPAMSPTGASAPRTLGGASPSAAAVPPREEKTRGPAAEAAPEAEVEDELDEDIAFDEEAEQ